MTRTIHFPRKRGGAGQFGDPQFSAELIEPDRAPIDKPTRVTERIEALLGLNAEQFRKIVMLPQGEFREFLKADSEKKGDILGKLFDSSAFVWYQKLIEMADKKVRDQREAQQQRLRVLMETGFQRPEEGAELYLPEHPELIENLRRLNENERAELGAREQALEAARGQLDALNHRKGAAEGVNRQLDDLARLEAHSGELEARLEGIERRRAAWALAGKALHLVRPEIERRDRAARLLEQTQREISRLKQDLEAQRQALRQAEEDAEGDPALQQKLTEVGGELRQIEAQLPSYEALERQARERKQCLDRARAAEEAQRTAEKALNEAAAKLELLDQALKRLENVDVELVNANSALEECQKRYRALKGARQEAAAIRKEEEALAGEWETFKRLSEEAVAAKAHSLDLYARFVAGQAGRLAGDLRGEIEKCGEANCPVCGTRIGREGLALLAVPTEDIPDEKRVKMADEAADAQAKQRNEQDTRVQSLAAALQQKQNALVERVHEWLPECEGWAQLSDDRYLDAALEKVKAEGEAARKVFNARSADQQQRNDAKKRKTEVEAAQKEQREKLEGSRREAEAQIARAKSLEAAMDATRAQLRYPDAGAAQQARQKCAAEQAQLDALLKKHQKALTNAKQQVSGSEGALQEKQSASERQAKDCDEAAGRLQAALKAAEFPDVPAAEAALLPIGGGDGEAWLQREQKQLSDFDHDRAQTAERVQTLRGETAGRERVDLTQLEAQIAAAAQERERLDKLRQELAARLANHESVLEKAFALKQALAGSEGAWKRIHRLAELRSSGNGTVTFDRFVIASFFEEVLERANQRLDRMSGGKYELALKRESARANGKAGLDVEVMDHGTGQRRDSGSLSGGEAFFTSLALALGLSDAVQSQAGGRRLDALFIDEGFGSLSGDVLDKALEVLEQLTEGDRLVGIISHVDKLDESIGQKIRVRGGKDGSRIDLI